MRNKDCFRKKMDILSRYIFSYQLDNDCFRENDISTIIMEIFFILDNLSAVYKSC